ncbi:MAG: sensor histidine kinase [Anaerolineae bacterium]|nr:sensor histidine kinase [Anaerolineae bacterium]
MTTTPPVVTNLSAAPVIEPGLLHVFRLLTTIRLGLALFSTLELVAGPTLGMREHVTAYWVFLSLLDTLVLLAYLSWPRLQRWMGRFYLPIAILISVVGPVAIQYTLRMQKIPVDYRDIIRAWQLLPILLIPLVITAWQYAFRYVIAFSFGTMFLDMLIMRLLVPVERVSIILNLKGVQIPVLVGIMGVLVNRTTVFVAVGFMVNRLMKTQREQRAALLSANTQLTHYAGTLEHLTVSRERNRLARELHDTLAHTLSGLAVQLDAVDALWETDPVEARALLGQSLAATRSGLTETRRALQDLRASPLDDLGLTLALETLATATAARAGLEAEVHLVEYRDGLTSAVEQCLYRVAQEALENVARHANASHVTLTLARQDAHVTLTVYDDGQGFDLTGAVQDDHLGLRGMQERAAMAGGALAIESAPGQGTTVRLEI